MIDIGAGCGPGNEWTTYAAPPAPARTQHPPEITNMPTPTDLHIGPEVAPWPPLMAFNPGEPPRRPATVIDEAAGIIHGARQSPHGRPERSFDAIAALWNGYLATLADKAGATFLPIKPYQVADMMELLKIARGAAGDPGQRDHYVDRIGYAALAHELVQGATS